MASMDALLAQVGHSLMNIRENDVFEVLTRVSWARDSLAEYVRLHRPDLRFEVLASLEELNQEEL